MANNILITRNKGIQKQEILLLEFRKNIQKQKGDQREQTMSTMSTQQSTCFCCWDDLSYGLNTLGPLCLWQCFWIFAIYIAWEDKYENNTFIAKHTKTLNDSQSGEIQFETLSAARMLPGEGKASPKVQ